MTHICVIKKVHATRMTHICVMAKFRAQICRNFFKSSPILTIKGYTCREEGWPSYRRVFELRFGPTAVQQPVEVVFSCATLPVRCALTARLTGDSPVFPWQQACIFGTTGGSHRELSARSYLSEFCWVFALLRDFVDQPAVERELLQCASFADLYKPICEPWTDERSAKLFSEA